MNKPTESPKSGGKLLGEPPPPREPEPAAEPEVFEHEPKVSFDLEHAGADIFAAPAQAQQKASTIGKDETNKHLGKNYASAEALIRGSRAAMAETGLAFMSIPRVVAEIAKPDGHAKQWPCARVEKVFVVTHASGQYIRGVSDTYAVESVQRPPDKAVAAADTYLHGFILRNLFNLDRAEEDSIAVDRREEGKQDEPRADKPRRRQTSYEAAETRFRELLRVYFDASGDQRATSTVIHEVVGYSFPKKPSLQNFQEGIASFEARNAEIAKSGGEEEDPTAKGAP